MKNLLFYTLVLFLPTQLLGQNLQPETQKLVRKLEKVNELDYEHVGFAGETSEQYSTFIRLRDRTTIPELLSLLHYRNSVVKGYAGWALVDKKYAALDKVLLQFLDSNASAMTLNGCIGGKDKLSTLFYYRVLYPNVDYSLSKSDSLFFTEQIKRLDSIILNYPHTNPLLKQALEHNNANPKTYDRIRVFALQDKNEQALIELAKYKKATDITSIKALGNQSFLAISYFSDEMFWPFLKTYLPTEKSLDFYLAIASYKNASAASVLTGLLNQLDKEKNTEQIKNLDEALIKQYCSNYQELLLTIWGKYKLIDLTATKILVKDDASKVAKGFAKGLLNDKKFAFLEIDDNYGTEDSILPIILASIAKYDKEEVTDICRANIDKTDYLDLVAFLDVIKSNHIQSLAEVLLTNLKTRRYAFEFFQITETLLSFRNQIINIQVADILKNNKSVWKSGNWTNEFEKLFKEYDIKI